MTVIKLYSCFRFLNNNIKLLHDYPFFFKFLIIPITFHVILSKKMSPSCSLYNGISYFTSPLHNS